MRGMKPAETGPKALEIVHGSEPVRASVIWLHGLGADGRDFAPVVEALQLPGVRFILPHAPVRPVSINGGYAMRAWYDIRHPDLGMEQDQAGFNAARRRLVDLIGQEEARGIKPDSIVIAGFSQGGAVALYTGVTLDKALGGILVLSAYLPMMALFPDGFAPAARHTPLFMAHGDQDGVIPLRLAEQSRELLAGAGFQVEWHRYALGHGVCQEEIADIRAWLVRILTGC